MAGPHLGRRAASMAYARAPVGPSIPGRSSLATTGWVREHVAIGTPPVLEAGGPEKARGLRTMERRLRIVGAVLAVIGVIAVAGGAYGYTRVQSGANALQGF